MGNSESCSPPLISHKPLGAVIAEKSVRVRRDVPRAQVYFGATLGAMTKRVWPALAAALAIAIAIAALREFHHSRAFRVGDHYAPIVLRSLEGEPASLEQQPGKPMVIDVFASWCSDCRVAMPTVISAARALGGTVDFAGVDQGESSEKTEAFARQFGVFFPIYLDPSGSTIRTLSARFIPTTVVIDGNGRIVYIRYGALDARELARMLSLQQSESLHLH